MTTSVRLFWLALAYFLAVMTLIALVRAFESHDLQDFAIFMHAGEAARQDLNPYVLYPHIQPYPDPEGFNLNPPISVLVFSAVTTLDVYSARDALRLLLIASFLVNLGLLYRHYRLAPLSTAMVAAGSHPYGGVLTGQFSLFWLFPLRERGSFSSSADGWWLAS